MSGVRLRLRAPLLVLFAVLAWVSGVQASTPGSSLPAFTEAEWKAQLALWREAARPRRPVYAPPPPAQVAGAASSNAYSISNEPIAQGLTSVPLLAPGTVSNGPSLDAVTVSGAVSDEESITNVQTAGIDEGGIIKQHGDHLVVLRRGRLFSIKVGMDALKPVSAVNAFGPEVDPSQGWYDELLISGDTIVVIGFHYGESATGIGLFDIDKAGRIAYRDTYYLRGDDYYSVSNSASRLSGHTLVFYTPVSLTSWQFDNSDLYPGLGHRDGSAKLATYLPTLPITSIHRGSSRPLSYDNEPTLHMVTRCDLSQVRMQCDASAVLGPSSRGFYVSRDAVYIWTSDWPENEGPVPSSVFRVSLDGAAPTHLQASGGPIDQLSFLEDDEGYLNVLLVADSYGDGMWAPKLNGGDAALLRVPVSTFGGLDKSAPLAAYHPLPRTEEWGAENRFVGDWLLYSGIGANDSSQRHIPLHALRYKQPEAVQTLLLPHTVDRIDALGSDGIVVGESERGDLHFTSLRLAGSAALAGSFIQPEAAQGESRTHGFFYKAQSDDAGILGLPILSQHKDGDKEQLEESASVIYLRHRSLRLSPMGQLAASPLDSDGADDGCQASCVDWYGNARPIFLGGRVFALMGYELVEGKLLGERIVERRRVDFTPPLPRR